MDQPERCAYREGHYAFALPGNVHCLEHASQQVRSKYFASVREGRSTGADGWLTNIAIDAELMAELRSLLLDVPSAVDLRYSTFNAPAEFDSVTFGAALFRGCKFTTSANFRDAHFGGLADFTNVTFGTHGTSFARAKFNGEALFGWEGSPGDQPQTPSALHLSLATLSNGARFDRRSFQFNLNLNDARVGGNLIMVDVVCKGEIILDRMTVTAPITIVAPADARISMRELTLTEPLAMTTHVTGSLGLGEGKAQLVSLRDATLDAPLTIGDGMALTQCTFLGATGLENFRVTAVDPAWRVFRRRRVIADEITYRSTGTGQSPLLANPRQVEAIYRQLRATLEASKAAPAAADFYYGEMEMRRSSSHRFTFERLLLNSYKWVSGYGLRASRALGSYLVLLLITTWFVADQTAAAGSAGLSFHSFWDVLAIVARSSVSFLSAVTTGLTAEGTLLFILLRLAGPATVALTIFAVRARVQR
jgi:hypothetical protein